MIQDIGPKVFNNAYKDIKPDENSKLLIFNNNQILCKILQDHVTYPEYKTMKHILGSDADYIYLFSIDSVEYFLVKKENFDIEIGLTEYQFENTGRLRSCSPKDEVFAGVTAYHLYAWYRNNLLCGRCGSKLQADHKERMLYCPDCHYMVYPKICPCIIVAITDHDRLLITKYANREYNKYALVAGFAEIGESLEDTVRREVMEEVGLKVKNIRYYKSQPWGYTNTLLCGFFAELDGKDSISLEEDELAEGKWITRDELDIKNEDFSLTNEMMCCFKNGEC